MKIKFLKDTKLTFYKSVEDSEEELIAKDTVMNVDDCGVWSSSNKELSFHEFQRGNGDFFAIPSESFSIMDNE